jgi:bisphosphoglycerate-independent phosphoglycerate mutase (AlkP superfamily)
MRLARRRTTSFSLPPITGKFSSCNGTSKLVLTLSSNAEEMKFEDGKPKTSHTTNKVPFIMANAPKGWSLNKEDGVLGDVAPTILEAMGLKQPEEMTGHSLLVKS